MKYKIKIEFEEDAEKLEDILKCKKCGKPLKPVENNLYKFDCTCQHESVRVSFG